MQPTIATFGHCMTCSLYLVILHKSLKGKKIASRMPRPTHTFGGIVLIGRPSRTIRSALAFL